MARTAAKEAEAPAVVLEEGTDPDTGRDRNSSVPRPVDMDAPAGAAQILEARKAAVERELEAYEAAGKKDRAAACKAELKRIEKELADLITGETTDGDGPEEVA